MHLFQFDESYMKYGCLELDTVFKLELDRLMQNSFNINLYLLFLNFHSSSFLSGAEPALDERILQTLGIIQPKLSNFKSQWLNGEDSSICLTFPPKKAQLLYIVLNM